MALQPPPKQLARDRVDEGRRAEEQRDQLRARRQLKLAEVREAERARLARKLAAELGAGETVVVARERLAAERRDTQAQPGDFQTLYRRIWTSSPRHVR